MKVGACMAVGLGAVLSLAGCGSLGDAASSNSSPVKGPSSTVSEPEGDGENFKFGQTAKYRSTPGSSDTPLEFTVSAPKSFTPSKGATFTELSSGFLYPDAKRQPNNVYFTVTIKNLSKSETWDATVDLERIGVDETGFGEFSYSEIVMVEDPALGDSAFVAVPPGKSVVVKDAFSLKSLDRMHYRLRLDGLAGTSFYWTK